MTAIFALDGEDFDAIFGRAGAKREPAALFPYAEFVRFDRDAARLTTLRGMAEELLREHFARRPSDNPLRAFAARASRRCGTRCWRARPASSTASPSTRFRQLGANFELLGSHLDWLRPNGEFAAESDGLPTPLVRRQGVAVPGGARLLAQARARAARDARRAGRASMTRCSTGSRPKLSLRTALCARIVEVESAASRSTPAGRSRSTRPATGRDPLRHSRRARAGVAARVPGTLAQALLDGRRDASTICPRSIRSTSGTRRASPIRRRPSCGCTGSRASPTSISTAARRCARTICFTRMRSTIDDARPPCAAHRLSLGRARDRDEERTRALATAHDRAGRPAPYSHHRARPPARLRAADAAVGPWRGVEIDRAWRAAPASTRDMRAAVEDGAPTLRVALEFAERPIEARARLICGGREAELRARVGAPARGDAAPARRAAVDAAYAWRAASSRGRGAHRRSHRIDLGRTGFRDIRVDRGADGA